MVPTSRKSATPVDFSAQDTGDSDASGGSTPRVMPRHRATASSKINSLVLVLLASFLALGISETPVSLGSTTPSDLRFTVVERTPSYVIVKRHAMRAKVFRHSSIVRVAGVPRYRVVKRARAYCLLRRLASPAPSLDPPVSHGPHRPQPARRLCLQWRRHLHDQRRAPPRQQLHDHRGQLHQWPSCSRDQRRPQYCARLYLRAEQLGGADDRGRCAQRHRREHLQHHARPGGQHPGHRRRPQPDHQQCHKGWRQRHHLPLSSQHERGRGGLADHRQCGLRQHMLRFLRRKGSRSTSWATAPQTCPASNTTR